MQDYGPKHGTFGLKITFKDGSYSRNWFSEESDRDKEYRKQNKLKKFKGLEISNVERISRSV